ncbi:MAG: tetratricopeptide repeat protein [Cyanobacteria bacterium J06632_22]
MKKHRWLDLTEYALLLGAGAGTVASVATQQMILASAPLSLLAALGLVSRQRLEQQLKDHEGVTRATAGKLTADFETLQDQVAELPTPELLTGFQRSIIAQNEQAVTRFSKALEQTRQQLEKQIEEIETPDLSLVYQDVVQLQDQYTYLCASINNISSQMQQLSSVNRLETTEADIAQLKTEMMQLRVNLETFSSDTKTSYAAFRDKIQHIERRIRQLPLQGNPSFLKEEVRELIKTVSEMVPRPEFLDLNRSFQELRDQHRQLRQTVQGLPAVPEPTPVAPTAAAVDETLSQMTEGLSSLEKALTTATENTNSLTPTVEATINQAVVNYLSSFRLQLSKLNQLTHKLEGQHNDLHQQLDQLPKVLDAAAMDRQMECLQARLDKTEEQLGNVTQSVNQWTQEAPHTTQMNGEAQWIFDFPTQDLQDGPVTKSSSRKVLDQALVQARKRLLLVWPWATDVELNDEMVTRFRQVLERKCKLEIGWCHVETEPTGRLLQSINQRWGDHSEQRRRLKTALNLLLPLKQAYPNLFKFKVLGTRENFLVCDRNFAVVGVQSLPTQTSVFPSVNAKIKTTNAEVIQHLVRRFDTPSLDPQDGDAYFNRGTTRYDLRDQPGAIADYSQVLELDPTHAVAYNNRGLAWADMGDFDKALSDFSRAINLDSHLFVAYCNRGSLRMERGDTAGAIADLTEAITLHPQSAIAFFYRGQAAQAVGDMTQAIADFGRAIALSPNLALPYCYRGAAYQKQGDTRRAVADLEVAARLLRTTGEVNNLTQVMRTLERLTQHDAVRATAQVG